MASIPLEQQVFESDFKEMANQVDEGGITASDWPTGSALEEMLAMDALVEMSSFSLA